MPGGGGGGGGGGGALASFKQGWAERAAAAGSSSTFLTKAVLEISLAVTFQLLAEVERRRDRFWLELDYVIAGTVSAVVGKGYTAWATSPTKDVGGMYGQGTSKQSPESLAYRGLFADVPTNMFAFGDFSPTQRLLALVKPAPRLFLVGAASAYLGNGFARLISAVRSAMSVASTGPPPVPLFGAAIFGGLFLVTVSNLSFQVQLLKLLGKLIVLRY